MKKFNNRKLNSVKKKLSEVGLHFEENEIDELPFLIVKKKAKSKKSIAEICFNEKGKIDYFVLGKNKNAAWIKVN
jgi:Sec7-like guanine-nucleotide exchange factor